MKRKAKNSHRWAILTVPKVRLMFCVSYNAASLVRRHQMMRGRCIRPAHELPWLGVKLSWSRGFKGSVVGGADSEFEANSWQFKCVRLVKARQCWFCVGSFLCITMTYSGHLVSHITVTFLKVGSNFTHRVTNYGQKIQEYPEIPVIWQEFLSNVKLRVPLGACRNLLLPKRPKNQNQNQILNLYVFDRGLARHCLRASCNYFLTKWVSNS